MAYGGSSLLLRARLDFDYAEPDDDDCYVEPDDGDDADHFWDFENHDFRVETLDHMGVL
ncbi:hypothetical protein [uncultured Agrobacterium sp.]|uniref:hypothetical protein n=1 Tax=uncultured Agrobacterium sp. TaxID=157277 RepID=UPI00258E6BF7|nr:hypothetical protein [uncultured Agrobacterium sp.]